MLQVFVAYAMVHWAFVMKHARNISSALAGWVTFLYSFILHSHESTFEILQNKAQFVRRHRGEKFHSDYVAQTVKHPTKIMIWSVTSGKGTGRLYVVKGMMRQDRYKDVLQNRLIPQLEEWFPNGEPYIFMQDGAPCRAYISVYQSFFSRTKYPSVGLAGASNNLARDCRCMPVISSSIEHQSGDNTICLGFTPILRENTLGVVRGLPPLFPFYQPHERTCDSTAI
ncbi:uncharacterized protein TNCV_369181 [Trichonephila clavipes]|nr:uncharacterized protein TNCV_369181 [Trichonephila clavipes]